MGDLTPGTIRDDRKEALTMARKITLTCADYARLMPLATGEVKPDGIALTMILGSRGLLARARRDAQPRGAGPGGAGRRVVDGAVSLPHRQGRSPLRRPADLPAAQLHRARSLRPPRRPDPPARRSRRQAYRHVQLHRQRLHLVSPLPALHRRRSRRRSSGGSATSTRRGPRPMDPDPAAGRERRRRRAGRSRTCCSPASWRRSTARRARRPITPRPGPSRGCSRTSAASSRTTSARPARFRLST